MSDDKLSATGPLGSADQTDDSVAIVRETTSVSYVTVAGPVAGATPGRSRVPLFAILGGVVALVLVLAACIGARSFLSGDSNPTPNSNALNPRAVPTAPTGQTTQSAQPAAGETGDGKQSGTLITTYEAVIVGGHSIPLGDTAPTQSQFDSTCKTGDICRNGSINAFFPVTAGTKLYTLTGHVPPTYAGCKATTLSAERVELAVGQTFCVLKKGRVAGITISYAPNSSARPVKITTSVWADWPGSEPVAEPAPSGPAPGTQVGTYSVTLLSGSVPLTDAKPDSSLNDPDCFSGDICRNRSLTAIFAVGIAVKMYNLEGTASATYQACTTTTLNASRIGYLELGVGHSFCVSRPGRVIGVTFTSMGRSADDPLVMTITVFADPLK